MRNHHNHCLSHKRQVLLGDVGGGDDDVADESVGGNEVNMTKSNIYPLFGNLREK